MDLTKIARQTILNSDLQQTSSSEQIQQIPSSGILVIADTIEPASNLNPVAQSFLENPIAELPDLVQADLEVTNQIGNHQQENRLGSTTGFSFNLPDFDLPDDTDFGDPYGDLFGFDPEHDLRINPQDAAGFSLGEAVVIAGHALREGQKALQEGGPGAAGKAALTVVVTAIIDSAIAAGIDNIWDGDPPDYSTYWDVYGPDAGAPEPDAGVPVDPAKTPNPDGGDDGRAIYQPWQNPLKIMNPAIDRIFVEENEPLPVLKDHSQAVDPNPDSNDYEPTALAASELPGFGFTDPTVDGIISEVKNIG